MDPSQEKYQTLCNSRKCETEILAMIRKALEEEIRTRKVQTHRDEKGETGKSKVKSTITSFFDIWGIILARWQHQSL
jgi:hypothetical protein